MQLNHAVLYVRDAARHAEFYRDVLGFRILLRDDERGYAFLRAPGSDNDHHLAFFTVGPDAAPSEAGKGRVGLYHLAWEVQTLGELEELRTKLAAMGHLVGESDHGVSRSLYVHDPDGLEFELMWGVPLELWDPEADPIGSRPLNLEADIERFGRATPGRQAA